MARGSHALLGGLAVAALSSCGETASVAPDQNDPGPSIYSQCDLDLNFIWASVVQDGIPSLDEPSWDLADQDDVPHVAVPHPMLDLRPSVDPGAGVS